MVSIINFKPYIIISVLTFTSTITSTTLEEKSTYIYLEQRKFTLILQPKRLFLCNTKNLFYSNVYLLYVKDHPPFLKLRTLFFDLKMCFLIVNTFSLRLLN